MELSGAYQNAISGVFDLVAIPLNALRPRQNGHQFPDNIFKCIFLHEGM